jgi:hypothetical protein
MCSPPTAQTSSVPMPVSTCSHDEPSKRTMRPPSQASSPAATPFPHSRLSFLVENPQAATAPAASNVTIAMQR